jgi:hypothetical protein
MLGEMKKTRSGDQILRELDRQALMLALVHVLRSNFPEMTKLLMETIRLGGKELQRRHRARARQAPSLKPKKRSAK